MLASVAETTNSIATTVIAALTSTAVLAGCVMRTWLRDAHLAAVLGLLVRCATPARSTGIAMPIRLAVPHQKSRRVSNPLTVPHRFGARPPLA